MATPVALILTDATLKISSDNTTANLKDLGCVTTHIELAPDTNVTTVDTLCGSTDYKGTTKWTLTCTLVQSFDVGATEEVLSAAVAAATPVAFQILPHKSQAISATNPTWTGLCVPRPYAPVNGDAGAASEISIEWGLVGPPVKTTTGSIPAIAGVEEEATVTTAPAPMSAPNPASAGA